MGETDGHPSRSDLSGTTVGRFRFEERLGAGATGEVYRATDSQLGRRVAIKLLRPTLRADASPTHGLLPEARRASALNHPGIASVYDLFTEGGEQFLVMEYVDGPTLRERLTSPLDLVTFRAIATQCAQALEAAHERHILHGDVKPANIMLTRDHETVKLCDFGLARYMGHQGSGVSDSASTVTPGLAGTPAYMAPEVAFELVPDERADVFSLGVVFYEMLAGTNPFATGSVVGTLDRIRTFSPRPLDEIRPDLPLPIARLVGRMLEKDRDRRVTTAGEAARELARVPMAAPPAPDLLERPLGTWRRVAFAAAVVAIVVAAVFGARQLSAPAALESSVAVESMHLAVLPFAVSGAGDKAAFVDGLVDALVERLSRLTVGHGLQVASVGDLRARRVASVADAREQLGANVALTGSIEYAGDLVRVSARLVDTRSGHNLDTRHFEGKASAPQALRDGIVGAAVALMGLRLDSEERRAFDRPDPAQPGAYDYYLQARGYLLNYDRLESLESAVSVFRKALEVDPRYASAYAGLGQAYWRKYELTRVSTWVEPARASCEGALAIDARLSEAHACLGMVLGGTGEYERAVTEFTRALELEPTNDTLYLGLATAFEGLQRPVDAERTYQRAIALRPHYWAAHNTLALYYYRRGRYDEALKGFQ